MLETLDFLFPNSRSLDGAMNHERLLVMGGRAVAV